MKEVTELMGDTIYYYLFSCNTIVVLNKAFLVADGLAFISSQEWCSQHKIDVSVVAIVIGYYEMAVVLQTMC